MQHFQHVPISFRPHIVPYIFTNFPSSSRRFRSQMLLMCVAVNVILSPKATLISGNDTMRPNTGEYVFVFSRAFSNNANSVMPFTINHPTKKAAALHNRRLSYTPKISLWCPTSINIKIIFPEYSQIIRISILTLISNTPSRPRTFLCAKTDERDFSLIIQVFSQSAFARLRSSF